jgi:hypothetical protein
MLSTAAHAPGRDGAPPEVPPEPSHYLALNVVYAGLLGALLAASRHPDARRDPIAPTELVPLGAAAFALSKVIAREKIGTWVREPFVQGDGTDQRRPRGHGLRHAVGELVTCTRCVGAWSALALVGARTLSPAAGRTLTNVLAVSAANDWGQAGFRWLCRHANADRAD